MVVDPPLPAEGCCAREACGQSAPNEAMTNAMEAQQTPRARILFFEDSTASQRVSLVCD
jgi:hypothetical protein